MRDAMLKFIKEKKLFTPKDKLMVAVSGGADSVALCHLLAQLNFTFIIAHCNFQLRGIESEEDEQFVKDLGKNLKVDVFIKKFDTQKIVKESNQSIQMVARELRYKWFEELRLSQNCDYIVTAHHKNDNLETVLLNLTKGTGIAGLHGIKPKNGNVVRPLLFATKEQILNFLDLKRLPFREDSSNASEKYERNLVRLQVIKSLKIINPSLEETFDQFIEKISLTEDIFNNAVAEFKSRELRINHGGYEIEIKKLIEEPGALIILYEVLKDFGFNYTQTKDLFQTLRGQSGKQIESDTFIALKDRNKILMSEKIVPKIEFYQIQTIPSRISTVSADITFVEVEKNEIDYSNDHNIVFLDLAKLSFPIIVRTWQSGDHFIPLGMKGKKKISDYLIDQKIPLTQKSKQLVVLSKDQIVWVAGKRLDDRFRITEKTEKILKITISESQSV